MTSQNTAATIGRWLALSLFAFAICLDAADDAHAACIDGTTTVCKVNGKLGTRECVSGKLAPCDINSPPNPPTPTPTPTPVTQTPGLFDLVPLPPYSPLDDNGLPLNPQWRWQSIQPAGTPNSLPSVADAPVYCGSNAWQLPCTSSGTTDDNWSTVKSLLGPLWYATWPLSSVIHGDNFCISGHHNWAPVTYTGLIFWESHSPYVADDDYNLRLISPPAGHNFLGVPLGAGVVDTDESVYPSTGELTTPSDGGGYSITSYPITKTPVDSASVPQSLGLEFNSEETIDHFTTTWWDTFHRSVDESGTGNDSSKDCYYGNTDKCNKLGKVQNMINGKYAIVTGLLGLDCAHDCTSELHPVFAMAIRVQDDPADEVWEIFVRRMGDEGFCSQDQHILEGLPNANYTFRLPSRGTSVQVTREQWATRTGAAVSLSYPVSDPRQGKLVSFAIPTPQFVPPPQQGGSGYWVSEMIHGELHLRWSGPTRPTVSNLPIVKAQIKVPALPRTAAAVGPSAKSPAVAVEAEGKVGQLVATMTPAQQNAFFSKIAPKAVEPHNAVPRMRAPEPAPGPPSGRPSVRSVVDPEKRVRDQHLLEAFRAVFGPKLDQNRTPPPHDHRTPPTRAPTP